MLVIDQGRELRFQAAQITRPLHRTSPGYLHLVSEGIRFLKKEGSLKKRKHTNDEEKKCTSAKSQTHVLMGKDPHACQLSYKASATVHGTAARKKCRNDGAGSLALRRCQVYAKKYP